jgi:hypothetical protein
LISPLNLILWFKKIYGEIFYPFVIIVLNNRYLLRCIF